MCGVIPSSALSQGRSISRVKFWRVGWVDCQQGFVVGVSKGRPVEGSRDHCAVVDDSELVMELVVAGEAWGADALLLQRF